MQSVRLMRPTSTDATAETDRRLFIVPLAAGLALLAPAALALAAHRVILFASLGPTAVMQAQSPDHRSSTFYAAVVSHLGGFAIAAAAVYALGVADEPSVFQLHFVDWPRAAAAVVAIMVAAGFEIAVRAPHPPAAATTLLVALGSMKPTWGTFGLVAIGVIAVAAMGEWLRRIGGADPRPPD